MRADRSPRATTSVWPTHAPAYPAPDRRPDAEFRSAHAHSGANVESRRSNPGAEAPLRPKGKGPALWQASGCSRMAPADLGKNCNARLVAAPDALARVASQGSLCRKRGRSISPANQFCFDCFVCEPAFAAVGAILIKLVPTNSANGTWLTRWSSNSSVFFLTTTQRARAKL